MEISSLPPGEEPTEEQVHEAEEAMIVEALSPLYDPRVRQKILDAKSSFEQVIDETTPDELLAAGYDEGAARKARELVGGFERFIEENREEIEALQVLYSRPYRAGLRYGQIKALARAVERPPLAATPEALWLAYEAVESSPQNRNGGKQLADLVSLVRHAIDHAEPLRPHAVAVEERYREWLAEQAAAGARFTHEQRRWLDAIKDHVATSLRIERDDFDLPPFSQFGGLGGVYGAFGDDLPDLLEELNERLAA
ncbi:MAG: hypothetical protein H0U55_11275 [Rubrobacteraceae bacterium]|nr:hypothetical protein [Rubrobacteraceae bacterium]